jgi:hypothetical protein
MKSKAVFEIPKSKLHPLRLKFYYLTAKDAKSA